MLQWEPSSKFCASSAHMGWAAAAMLLAPYLHWNVWVPTGVFMAYAFLKEYWADARTFLPFSGWLENDSIAGTTCDFLMYLLGCLLGDLALVYPVWGIAVSIIALVVMAFLDNEGFFDLLKDTNEFP